MVERCVEASCNQQVNSGAEHVVNTIHTTDRKSRNDVHRRVWEGVTEQKEHEKKRIPRYDGGRQERSTTS